MGSRRSCVGLLRSSRRYYLGDEQAVNTSVPKTLSIEA